MRGSFWLILAGLFGATAVAIGAFHAHGLGKFFEQMSLDPPEIERRLAFVETAYRYQIIHALALLGVGTFLRTFPISLCARFAGSAFFVGIVLFSGSLYALAYSGEKLFAHVTPFGGAALMIGWICIALIGLFTPPPEMVESPWSGS